MGEDMATLSRFNADTGEFKIFSSYDGELIYEEIPAEINYEKNFSKYQEVDKAIRKAEKIASRFVMGDHKRLITDFFEKLEEELRRRYERD
jgi:t-SNARE complex subunit (syntaxin)